MPYDRFLIGGPFKSGIESDVRPLLIADDAYENLENAYTFRGRLRKRFGSELLGGNANPLNSRLGINLGTVTSGDVPGSIFKIGQAFSVGTTILTVYQSSGAMLTTNPAITGTYDTSDGAYVITGSGATDIIFYPAEPVMGLTNYENGLINNQPSYAFDTQFAYVFSGGKWTRSGTSIWHWVTGTTKTNFFWTYNYRGSTANVPLLFVTNFQVTNLNGPVVGATDDPIWYFDGSTWTAAKFYFAPGDNPAPSGPYVGTAKIIVAFKDRLILLNTVEVSADGTTNSNFAQRARYSAIGSPLETNAWYEQGQTDGTLFGVGASYIDNSATQEQIVSAEFIKDRLIVYYERSTWELSYTGSQFAPFVWQKLNTELGADSQFSVVPFDKVILNISNVGVHACNGSNVERIDTKIPQEIFEVRISNNANARVAGIRDYYVEMVYWNYIPNTASATSNVYPSKVLVYNYRQNTWSINDDCITAWGYFEQSSDVTWAQATNTWAEATWSWNAGVLEAQSRTVLAGNQQGYTFLVLADEGRNAPAMQITNITSNGTLTIIDHTLELNDYIALENCQGVTFATTPITEEPQVIFQVQSVQDNNTVIVGIAGAITGVYTGGGTATRVSNYNILTKQWNPYFSKDRNVYLQRIDFGVEKTSDGEITVDYYPSATYLSMIGAGSGTGSIMGTGVLETFPYDPTLYPLEQEQDRLWHPVYFQTDGTCIQLNMYMTLFQIIDPAIAWSDFQLDGMVLYTMPTTYRMQ